MKWHVRASMVMVSVALVGCAKGDSTGDSEAASIGVDASAAAGSEISADSVAKLMNPDTPAAAGAGQLHLSISKSKDREGSYRDAGAVRTCGSSAGGKDFTISFAASGPGAKDHPLQNLTFHAADLTADGSTKSFKLEATIQDLDMQKLETRPLPAFLLEPGTSGTGTARLSSKNNEMRLEVDGTTAQNEKVELTVTCNKA